MLNILVVIANYMVIHLFYLTLNLNKIILMNMKNLDFKIGAFAYLLFFALFTGTMFAQSISTHNINITGTFEGLRSQFDKSHKKYSQVFQYKYDLVQTGNKVEGVSIIISEKGNYAEVGIRGVVIANKFYFEEYNMIDEIKPENNVWCYKSGVLNIEKNGNEIILSGETPSFMVNYGFACTGGFTKLSAIVENNDEVSFKNYDDSNFLLQLYPNPTVDKISFSFSTEESTNITVEVFDISGRVILKPITRRIGEGQFSDFLNLEKYPPGIYIFKIRIGKDVYSKEFIKLAK